MFVRHKGKTKFMYHGSTASQLVSRGAVVALDTGRIIPAEDDTNPSTIVGVINHAITASDPEYGTAGTPVEVEVPVEMWVEWKASILADDLANTDQGTYMDLTTADTGLEVNTAVSTLNTCFCTAFISASEGLFVLNIGPYYWDHVGD